ncbi:hypothetical protein ANCDUO_10420 [Ancylostoma duodenale]|uniref:Uncharacterized protein n=1 Tax=Ancylostoma duodenale TaxID=51022 RepID=A0A0C2GDZ4_9BILA|nr:hypothetical protein ANCDUO_10420 [Ancylostoma duodenale]
MPVGGGSSSRSGRLARISQSNIRPFGSGGAGGGYGPARACRRLWRLREKLMFLWKLPGKTMWNSIPIKWNAFV